MAASKNLKCAVCNKSDAQQCGSCHAAAYCGSECQATDWKLHKSLCKHYRKFLLTRPVDHKLGILFPVNSDKPQLIWLKTRCPGDWFPDENENPNFGDFLGVDKPIPELWKVQSNRLRKFDLEHGIHLAHRPGFVSDGSDFNVSIASMTGEGVHSEWKGPVLFYSAVESIQPTSDNPVLLKGFSTQACQT